MASLVQKFRTLISANLHFLVDKALQSQSLAVLDEYIRKMTEQMRELHAAIETVYGNIKTVQRRHAELGELLTGLMDFTVGPRSTVLMALDSDHIVERFTIVVD